MRHPYASFLHKVRKPGRYLGEEYNQIRKAEDSVDVRICLAFPDVYDIGMSHLGTKILYSLLNKDPRIACERAFAPWPDMEAELRSRQLPLLSLENHLPLAEFDVVGVSLQYEMTYTNILTLLDLGGIPLRAADRGSDDPLVMGGGPNALHPEPVAPFFDLFLIGEAEDSLADILLRYRQLVDGGANREARILSLVREFPGLYAPSLYTLIEDERSGLLVVDKPRFEGVPPRIKKVWVDDLARHPFPDDFPVPVAEAVFDRMSIEIARGCTEGCRFCQAGMVYRPMRERDPRTVADTLLAAAHKGGFDEASLTALSTADYSCIEPLIHELSGRLGEERISLSVSSLRAYGLDGGVLDDIRAVRATGLTFAPEAGTQRLRDLINKNVTDEALLSSAREVFSRGWERIKLYFMIGLPTENEKDLRGIVDTAERIRAEGRRTSGSRRAEVTISVSSHVPKPHTPFQWVAMDSIEQIETKQQFLQEESRALRLKLKWHDPLISHLEGIAARGDRRVAEAIQLAWERGCRFDGWGEHLRFDLWQEALRESGLDCERYLGTMPVDARLPWDHIDVGLEDGFLSKEYRQALKGRLSPPCGKPLNMQVHHTNLTDHDADQRKLICYHCGVACDLEGMRGERADFLLGMGAEQVRERAPRAEQPKRGHRQPLPFDQPSGQRYRLQYTKLGAERFVGHLDIIRVLPRVFRRAGITLNYSQGFHPHPLLSFGPALALGVAALGEYCDAVVGEEIDAEELRTRLNQVSAEGLRVEAVRRLAPGEPKLMRVLHRADYLLAFDAQALQGDLAALEHRCRDLCALESFQVQRTDKKGREKERNLMELIDEARVVELHGMDPRLDLDPDWAGVALGLRLDQGWSLRPAELVPYLGLPELLATVRIGCWGEAEGQRSHPLSGAPVADPFGPMMGNKAGS